MIFAQEHGHPCGPRLLVACQALSLLQERVLWLSPLMPNDTSTTKNQASPPPTLLGRHAAAWCPLVLCTPSATGAEGLRRRSPPTRSLLRPSDECSRASRMYHSLISRRSYFGVVKSRFGRCSPRALLMMPSTYTLWRACAPANCGFPIFLSRTVVIDFSAK